MNCCGPTLLAMESGAGGLEFCNIMEGAHKTADYAAIHAYQQVPGMKDGDVCIGESNAIIRYIALNYAPSTYPLQDPGACARADMALDSWTNVCYKSFYDTVYVTYGYHKAPADQTAANAKFVADVTK